MVLEMVLMVEKEEVAVLVMKLILEEDGGECCWR